MSRYDVIVVGGGIAGMATALHLARGSSAGAPLRCLLVEREASLGRGSSRCSAGILRTFVEDAEVAELARRGARALREPPGELGSAGFVDAVGLLLVAEEPAAAERMSAGAAAFGGTISEISGAGARRLAPRMAREPALAFHCPDEGHLDTDRLLSALGAALSTLGVEVRTGCEVAGLLRSGDHVEGLSLRDAPDLLADRVCLAAGGFADELARAVGSRVRFVPTRRHLAVLAAGGPVPERTPVVWNGGPSFYSRWAGDGWMACACDQDARSPRDAGPDPDRLAAIVGRADEQLAPGVLTDPRRAVRAWCGLRTFSSPDGQRLDERFTIGADPDVSGLFWAAGLGGHGMTTGLEVGRLAALALTGGGDPLLECFAPGRGAPEARPVR